LNTAFILLPDFILILAAWGLNRYTILNQSVWSNVEQLVYWVLFPCLLFSSALSAKLDLLQYIPMLLLLATCMGLTGCLAYSARWFIKPNQVNLVSGIQTTMRFNTYVVLAVGLRILGPSDLEMMIIMIACVVPFSNAAAIYTLSIGSKISILPQLLKNPFVISTLLGLLFNALQIHLPDLIDMNLRRVGATAIPLGLMTVGATLSFTESKKDTSLVAYWTFLKLMVLPALTLLGAKLIHLPNNQTFNVVLLASMPTAVGAYVLTNKMGGNGSIVAITISVMTLVAVLTVPLWLFILGILN
jgi:malonate transporter and related proteins